MFLSAFFLNGLTIGLNCTHNRPKLHSASPRANICLLPNNFFPNCTQTHVVTYTNNFLRKIILFTNPCTFVFQTIVNALCALRKGEKSISYPQCYRYTLAIFWLSGYSYLHLKTNSPFLTVIVIIILYLNNYFINSCCCCCCFQTMLSIKLNLNLLQAQ